MPGLLINGSASLYSSSEGHNGVARDGAMTPILQTFDDVEYPAVTFPGYAEKSLSEQLEPIAVIGMGTDFSLFRLLHLTKSPCQDAGCQATSAPQRNSGT